ncbi:MAG TPA: hypothetical protein PLX06_08980 [Fimbriimonadaceae bacterium]|nr:hypothetical protein [Fimbriimonadaceae bacterium]
MDRTKGYSRSHAQSGAALITALVVALMVSVLVGGVGMLSVSHYNRARRESDYARALQIAEAGINAELRFISENHLTGTPSHTSGVRYTGSLSGGTFEAWTTAVDGSTWSPPNDFKVQAIGTIDGLSRRVEVSGTRQSIFNEFSIFGIQSVNFNGSVSITNGDVGTNGSMNVVNPTSNVPAPGEIYLMGSGASINSTGSNVVLGPNPVLFPTIDQIIVKPAPVGLGSTGWSWLTSNSPLNRNNRNMRTFRGSGAALTPGGTQQVGLPWSGTNAASMQIANNDFNRLGTNPATGNRTLTIPPGDYYFTDMSVSGTREIIIDNGGLTTGTPGMVRIWMNNSNGGDHLNNIQVTFTAATPNNFRLYYNKCASLRISGGSTWYGGIYAVRTGCTGTIDLSGGAIVNGSVIANAIVIAGGATINFPSNGAIDHIGDFGLWYGFRDGWKEVNSGGAVTFIDGTNK